MTAVVTNKLGVSLGGKKVLKAVDFEARPGEITGLIGPNGAGKSTLLRAIVGLVPVEAGEIQIAGIPAGGISRLDKAKAVSYLPQLAEVHWPLTAEALVALGRYPHGKFPTNTNGIIAKSLKAVDAMHLRGREVLSLSAGERARVLLARALAVEAPLLLADEPVASLDPEHQLKVMAVLRALAKDGRAVVIVLHDLTLAARFCDTLFLLNKGRLAGAGTPDKVLSAKKPEKRLSHHRQNDPRFYCSLEYNKIAGRFSGGAGAGSISPRAGGGGAFIAGGRAGGVP